MNFSIAIISKNEEKTLPRMIGSLKEFQERGGVISILDTGSTDKTVEIAKSLGCIVYEVGDKFVITIDEELTKKVNEKFIVEGELPIVKAGDKQFDYASARNYLADLCPTDFLFTPDADECFTTFNIDKIIEAIDSGIEQLEYNFVFSHLPDGSPAIKFMHCKAYDRRKLKWSGIVHEVLIGEAKRQFVGEDVVYLEHYQNAETNRSHYLRGLAIDCYEHQESDRNSHYLGRELLWTDRPHSAIKELERHITMDKWPTEKAQSMIYIGDAYLKLGNDVEAINWYQKSFQLEPKRREAIMRLAQYFYEKADAQKVACYCAMALEIPESGFYANDLSQYTNLPHELMYWAKWQLGDIKGSKEHWNKAYNFQPHNDKYLHDARFYIDLPKMSFIIPTLGREEGLQKCIDSIKKLNYPQEKIEIIVKQDEFGENNQGVPKLLKQGVEESTGDFIVFASNDIEFTPNSIIEAFMNQEGGFCSFNTGELYPDEGNINEHFMISKQIIPMIGGEIFNTDFHHIGCDNLLWAKMKKLGIEKRVESAVVIHNHFTKGAPMDDVYSLAYKYRKEDRALLKVKLEQYGI